MYKSKKADIKSNKLAGGLAKERQQSSIRNTEIKSYTEKKSWAIPWAKNDIFFMVVKA